MTGKSRNNRAEIAITIAVILFAVLYFGQGVLEYNGSSCCAGSRCDLCIAFLETRPCGAFLFSKLSLKLPAPMP